MSWLLRIIHRPQFEHIWFNISSSVRLCHVSEVVALTCNLSCPQLSFVSYCLYRYEVLFAPQPPAASCQFLSSVELTLQHQVADTNDRVMHQAERLKAEGTTAATCEEQVQEIEHCITVFLRENEEQGSLSLAGIITSALCTLCRFNTSFILCFTVLFIQSE